MPALAGASRQRDRSTTIRQGGAPVRAAASVAMLALR
jgi:hypothetical protein